MDNQKVLCKENKKQQTFLKISLVSLGFNPSHCGTRYLIKLIILAYNTDLDTINVRELCKTLADKESSSNYNSIFASTKYAISTVNMSKAKSNFEDVFDYSFDLNLFTTKILIEEFLTLLENNF